MCKGSDRIRETSGDAQKRIQVKHTLSLKLVGISVATYLLFTVREPRNSQGSVVCVVV